jgi:Na+/H+ antiporter NhaD/arsenite permease-like protein
MEVAIISVFIVGYLVIALEHPLKINKTATALITGVICWTLFILSTPSLSLVESEHYTVFKETLRFETGEKFSGLDADTIFQGYVSHELGHHLEGIAEILFFLLGAMTIVELIDAHNGFRLITERIKTKNPATLLWVICWMTFFLSALLDNLTSTIVMVSLVRKLIPHQQMKLFFVGMMIIASNAGGAWTPIGDVTTTMLWIGGQISTLNIMKTLFLPSVVCLLLPLLWATTIMKREFSGIKMEQINHQSENVGGGKLVLFIGTGILLGVPAFKVITHLPPYIGMLLGLGILWLVSELIHPELDEAIRKRYTAAGALARIDVPSILFFLGILLAVGAMESMLILQHVSEFLQSTIGDQRIIISVIGVLSAIVDNVPLVAASMGMYSLETYPMDHFIWEYLAYCAGTGGSLLIIGSAAGVAAMGMEKIDFIWYVKKISWLALIGYVGGAVVFLLMNQK